MFCQTLPFPTVHNSYRKLTFQQVQTLCKLTLLSLHKPDESSIQTEKKNPGRISQITYTKVYLSPICPVCQSFESVSYVNCVHSFVVAADVASRW